MSAKNALVTGISVLLIAVAQQRSLAASAIAFNDANGAFSAGHGKTIQDAEYQALVGCPGGHIIYSGTDKGYWTVARTGPLFAEDKDPHIIGFAAGAPDPHTAQTWAYNDCLRREQDVGATTRVALDGGAPWYEPGAPSAPGMSYENAIRIILAAHGSVANGRFSFRNKDYTNSVLCYTVPLSQMVVTVGKILDHGLTVEIGSKGSPSSMTWTIESLGPNARVGGLGNSGVAETNPVLWTNFDDPYDAERVAQALRVVAASSQESGMSRNLAGNGNQSPPLHVKGYYHILQQGETLELIARAYTQLGVQVSADDIAKYNNISAMDNLVVGQRLFIPKLH